MSLWSSIINPQDLTKVAHLDLLATGIVDGFVSGRHRSKLKGGAAEFAEHRAYSPGDELRLLDWRVYGKSDRYCVKQFNEDTSLQAIMVVDGSGSMGFGMSGPSKYEYSRAACLCLTKLMLNQGDSVALAVLGEQSVFIPARARPSHFEVVTEQLESFSPSGKTSLSEELAQLAGRIKRRGLFFIFSDAFGDVAALGKTLKLLRSRRHEVVLFHVMAGEELSFEFGAEHARFESMEQRGLSIDLDPAAVRSDYLTRLKTFLTTLRRTCGEAGCEYFPLPTNQQLGTALLNFLRRRAAKGP